MGRQRFRLPNARGRLFQTVPTVAAPPAVTWVPGLLSQRRRALPARRARLGQRVIAPGAGPARHDPVAGRSRRRRMLPLRSRDRAFEPPFLGLVEGPGPLVGQTLRPRVQRLPYPHNRKRIINWVIPNQVLPPGFQPLPPSLTRTSERLLLRPQRGRIFGAPLVGLPPAPPYPFRVLSTPRPKLIPRRSGHTSNMIFPGLPPAGPGPLAPGLTRQTGLSSRLLIIRRGSIASPPWPSITPPPPPPPPVTDNGLDVGSSVGRKMWRRRHVAVKYELSKSLVWERYNG